MTALIRLVIAAAAIYGYCLVAYPDGPGRTYHAVSLVLILGVAVAVFVLLKLIDLSSRLGKLAIELGFVLGVAAYLGLTMPQASGKPPLRQWLDGRRPTRADARRGIARLGLDPDSRPAGWILPIFPAK